jgi:3D (Asp-Asp-Asp) domain-containing protein
MRSAWSFLRLRDPLRVFVTALWLLAAVPLVVGASAWASGSAATPPQASANAVKGKGALVPAMNPKSKPKARGAKRKGGVKVTATAFNSLRGQTDSTPNHGAWGDRLSRTPRGVRAAAVSRDLLCRGYSRKQRFRIEGMAGEFLVLDTMSARWKQRVDIYMGKDRRAAKRFGRRKLHIYPIGPLAKPKRSYEQCMARNQARARALNKYQRGKAKKAKPMKSRKPKKLKKPTRRR